MNASPQPSSTKDSATGSHSWEALKGYHASSHDLKEGLEVVEINTDALPASWRERWNQL
jgi:hypothetical protein